MSETHCPACGASYAVVGRVHRCRGYAGAAVNSPVNSPKPVNTEANNRIAELEAENAALRAEIVKLRAEAGKPADRKVYMRDYMRRRRAQERA